jgi:adenine C2-methylase RlmN of 23S rRNA A2503 and tRNA A37
MKVVKTINLECGQTYLFEMDKGEFLEGGDVFMSREKGYGTRPYHFKDFEKPADTEKRVMTICTMLGCCCSCKFCASRDSFKRNLTKEEILEQVDVMIAEGIKNGRDADPNNSKEFRILYTRMGEPMLNAENVIASIEELTRRYPHVIIGMSTSGYGHGIDLFLKKKELLKNIDIQFSLHSTNDSERGFLFGSKMGKSKLSIPQIAEYANKWYDASGKKVCLNVILFDGFEYDFKGLLRYFNRDKIWLRLSPWNVVASVKDDFGGLLQTEDVLNKKPMTSDKLKEIMENIKESGIAYSYAPAIDEEIKHNVACGQALEVFREDIL